MNTEPCSFAELLDNTQRYLEVMARVLAEIIEHTDSDRSRMLASTFASQHAELMHTIERIQSRQSQRALDRRLLLSATVATVDELAPTTDSRTLTHWVVVSLQHLSGRFEQLLSRGRLGAAESAVGELQRLLVAHAKRLALEAHRFEDL